MKSEWFEKSSLTVRESAWILLRIDPDDAGEENQKKPYNPPRQGNVPQPVVQHFNDYLHILDILFRDVALGIIPIIREPWNRFPHCFIRIGHLATWSQHDYPESAALWSDHGVIQEPLPPPPPEWEAPEGEDPTLSKIRNQMILRAATHTLNPMMQDEMAWLLQWSSSTHHSPVTPSPIMVKNALRPLYKVLRNLPVLEA